MNQLFEHNEPWIWLAGWIVFLLVYAATTVWLVNKKKNTANPRQILTLYMLLRGIRFLLILAIISFYIAFIRIEIKKFLIAAVAFYVLYLLFDTFYLLSVEKKLKKENGKK